MILASSQVQYAAIRRQIWAIPDAIVAIALHTMTAF